MKGCIVFLEEEFGYRYWTWHTGMNERDLLHWWRKQTDLTDSRIRSLPGKVERYNGVDPSSRLYYAHIHKNDDSYLKIVATDEIIKHAGYQEVEYGTDDLVSDSGKVGRDSE